MQVRLGFGKGIYRTSAGRYLVGSLEVYPSEIIQAGLN